MTGNVKISAKKRLTLWSSPDTDDTSDDIIENSDDVKAKMIKIINIAISGQGLENLRTKSENIELLHTFVSYCLIHFTTSINWWYNACSVVISEIFTDSDEALYILLIENSAEDYAKMYREQIIIIERTRNQNILKWSVAIKNSKVRIEEVSEDSIVLWPQ